MTGTATQSILERIEIADCARLAIWSDGIIEIEWNPDLSLVTLDHILRIREILKRIGKGEKVPVFFNTKDFLDVSEGARTYSATAESGKYTLANAVLIDNLAKKLIFNFYLHINKPVIPTRGFRTREEAIAWLKEKQK